MKNKVRTISVKQIPVNYFQFETQVYILLTDMVNFKNPKKTKGVVKNWLSSKNNMDFLGLCKKINNPEFKGGEFDYFLFKSESNSFTLSPLKWIEATAAIGILSRHGRGGGTSEEKLRENFNNLAYEKSNNLTFSST